MPSIARVLAGTGKMTAQPKARAKATGELVYTLIEHGLASAEGEVAVAVLRRLHASLPAGDQEYLYVLAAFCVAPLRWIDAHSWRATTRAEKAAAFRFYAGLADRMDIAGLPGSYDEFAVWMDDFEQRHFAVTPESQALYDANRALLADRFPAPLGVLVRALSDALLDERLRARRPARPVGALVTAGLRWRAWSLNRRRPRPEAP
ncbi:oxygenase MpaB family protein [Streptomyces telluris]|uniref:DUF2236 domain-containing protein n=1 Tax=Streptomyces telluris TaxID=2720021 RepID=A0A9X2LSD5_9ACTN|nr:oxygenase MpaB family protein [Streptomyces telluris]MCQ8774800.1 DUF2236 domain-containing protein [Streptomyces telluris]